MKLAIAQALQSALSNLYQIEWPIDTNIIQKTNREFEGDFTIVVFPFVKQAHKAPDVVANELGTYISQSVHCHFNVVKGFLNLVFDAQIWYDFIQ